MRPSDVPELPTVAFVVDDVSERKNGTAISCLRYARALRELGCEVRLVAHGATGPSSFPLPRRSIPLVSQVAARQGFIFGAFDEGVATRAFDGVDLVHLYLPFKLEQDALAFARRRRIPVSAGFHLQPENITFNAGLAGNKAVPRLVYRRFDTALYAHVRHVHCPSRFMAAKLHAMGYSCTTHVISNGIADDFTPGPTLPFADGLFHVLTTGRLAPEKDQETIVRAVGRCRHRDQVQLHIAGTGPLQRRLSRLGARLPHPATVGFLPKDRLIALERACQLYVHASIVDSEAISCMEAIACGLPPVISDSPLSAPSQFAMDEHSLFPVGDADALAQRIDWWVDHPRARAAASEECARMGDDFRVERCARRFVSFARTAIACDRAAYEEGR